MKATELEMERSLVGEEIWNVGAIAEQFESMGTKLANVEMFHLSLKEVHNTQ